MTEAVRAVTSEAEFLRKAIAKRWFGDEWRPDGQWKLEVLGAARDAMMPPIHVNQFRIIYWRGVPTAANGGSMVVSVVRSGAAARR